MNPAEAQVKAWWFDRMSELASNTISLSAALGERDKRIAELEEKLKVKEPAAA